MAQEIPAMLCPKARRRRLWLGVLLMPPALWALILVIVPTDWARARLVDRLERSTHRRVSLGGVRLGVFGGVRMTDLEIGEPAQDRSPWLRVEALQADINLLRLLSGSCGLSYVQADGMALRVHRRKDGSFEFGDLLHAEPRPEDRRADADLDADGEHTVQFRVAGLTLKILDEPSDTRVELDGVEAHGHWQRRRAVIQELKGQVNGGRFELAAQLDRVAHGGPAFEGQLRATGVGLGSGMKALSYVVPVLGGLPPEVDGKLDLDLDVHGHGDTGDEVEKNLVGQGSIQIGPLRMDGSKLVADLSTALKLPAAERSGALRSGFEIRDGRISSKDLTLTIGRFPVILSGWTDFRGQVDYRVDPESLANRLSGTARELLLDILPEASNLAALHVKGTIDDLTLTVDGVALTGPGSGDPAQRAEARARLREAGRKLGRRIFR